jgi:glucan phosphoethanolaminetransferase (alkaline phosphatase superfamily)
MNRKQFLGQLWQKMVLPIATIIMAFYCLKFLFLALSQNGNERADAMFFFGLSVLVLIVAVLQIITTYTLSLIPENIKLVFGKISLVASGALMYYSWTVNKGYTIGLGILLLIQLISESRQNKPKQTSL